MSYRKMQWETDCLQTQCKKITLSNADNTRRNRLVLWSTCSIKNCTLKTQPINTKRKKKEELKTPSADISVRREELELNISYQAVRCISLGNQEPRLIPAKR